MFIGIGGMRIPGAAKAPALTETLSFSDDFNRANETLSANANWTNLSGTAAQLAIVSNQVATGGTDNATLTVCPNLGTANQYVSAAWLINSASRGFLAACVTDASNYIAIQYNGTAYVVIPVVAGSGNTRITATIGFVSGQIIKLRRYNTLLQFFVDGVQLGGDYTLTGPEAAAIGNRAGFRNSTIAATIADTFRNGTVTFI